VQSLKTHQCRLLHIGFLLLLAIAVDLGGYGFAEDKISPSQLLQKSVT